MVPIGGYTVETVAYALFAATLAIVFWVTLALLLVESRRNNHWLTRAGLMAVVLNAALFWTAACVARLLDLNRAAALNTWSRISYAMLAFYVLGYAVVNWKGKR